MATSNTNPTTNNSHKRPLELDDNTETSPQKKAKMESTETKEHTTTSTMSSETKAQFVLADLPYGKDALAPHISEKTLSFHYGKHHQGYVNVLNDIAKTNKDVSGKSLDEIVKTFDAGKPFNMAAQIWNHSFYWNSMSPKGGNSPSGDLGKAVEHAFGSYDKFKDAFTGEASGHFGSGWAWLVCDNEKKLKVISTHDAGCPLNKNDARGTPLLVCDVWEHAYYLDYQNLRADYIKSWWKLINWDFAEKNYSELIKNDKSKL